MSGRGKELRILRPQSKPKVKNSCIKEKLEGVTYHDGSTGLK